MRAMRRWTATAAWVAAVVVAVVSFDSFDSNLVVGDTNGKPDVFVATA